MNLRFLPSWYHCGCEFTQGFIPFRPWDENHTSGDTMEKLKKPLLFVSKHYKDSTMIRRNEGL